MRSSNLECATCFATFLLVICNPPFASAANDDQSKNPEGPFQRLANLGRQTEVASSSSTQTTTNRPAGSDLIEESDHGRKRIIEELEEELKRLQVLRQRLGHLLTFIRNDNLDPAQIKASEKYQKRINELMWEIETIEQYDWSPPFDSNDLSWSWNITEIVRIYNTYWPYPNKFSAKLKRFVNSSLPRKGKFNVIVQFWKKIYGEIIACLEWELKMQLAVDRNQMIDPIEYGKYIDDMEKLYNLRNDRRLYCCKDYHQFTNNEHRRSLMENLTNEDVDFYTPVNSDSGSDDGFGSDEYEDQLSMHRWNTYDNDQVTTIRPSSI